MIQLGPFEERWRDGEGLPEATLLRLGVARDLSRAIHAERSQALSQGQKQEIGELKRLQGRLDALREKSPLAGELGALLDDPSAAKRKTRLLPDALFHSIDREKLTRYDRLWEAAIAGEACALGWGFWALSCWVKIDQAEAWENAFRTALWPNGLTLFADAVDQRDDFWQGRWTMVLHPRFRSAADLSPELALDPARMSGAADPAPTAPSWKLLFSPVRR